MGKGGKKGKGSSAKGSGGSKGAGDESLSPALLNSYIKNSWTVESLFQNCTRYQTKFNHIHVSACWNKLGHLAKESEEWYLLPSNVEALESLAQHTLEISKGADIQARQLANISHGIAKSGACKSGSATLTTLMTALAGVLHKHLSDCNSQELANVAWAFAKSGQVSPDLFSALASTAKQKWYLDNFNAQEVANITWAFATAAHTDTKLFEALGGAVEQRLDSFSTQGLANTAAASSFNRIVFSMCPGSDLIGKGTQAHNLQRNR